MKWQMFKGIFGIRLRYVIRNGYLRAGIVACVMGSMFFFWSYFIYYHQWKLTNYSYVSRQNDLRSEIRYLKQSVKGVERYGVALEVIRILENRLSSSATQIAIAEHVNALARRSGVSIDASTFKTEVYDGGVKKSHQEIILSGSYSRLRSFIIGLSELPTLTVPSEVLIQKAPDKSANLNARIHLISYQIQPQDNEVE